MEFLRLVGKTEQFWLLIENNDNRGQLMIDWTNWNRHLYSAWAPFYDVLVSMLEGKRRRSLQLADIRTDEDVLLLGAGTGLDLKYLTNSSHVTAVDITPAMIKRLRRRAEALNLSVDSRVMDGQSLDFHDNSFDVVVLHFVLAVIPDPQRAIHEATRVLRPGGRVVILNKFIHDDSPPSVFLNAANKIARLVATDITCKLAPIIEASQLKSVFTEEVGLGGFFKIAILEKPVLEMSPDKINDAGEVVSSEPEARPISVPGSEQTVSGSQPLRPALAT